MSQLGLSYFFRWGGGHEGKKIYFYMYNNLFTSSSLRFDNMNERGRFSVPMAFATVGWGWGE